MSKRLDQLIQEKLDRLESVPNNFVSGVDKEQIKIYKKILSLLNELDRSGDVVDLNDKNVNILLEINNEIVKVVRTGGYKELVEDFISEFDGQLEINNTFFEESLGKTFIVSKDSEQIVSIYKQGAFNDLFSKNSLLQSIANPVNEALKETLTTNGSFIDLTEQIRSIIVGDSEKQGKLKTYAGQIAWDTFATSDRAYTKSVSDANNIQFYRYAGGLVEDSRSFCIHRNNNYYHKKEIEMWGKGKEYSESKAKFVNIKEWKGRIEGTNENNIFTNLGGYRCLHSIIPVPLSAVPIHDLLKAKELGFLSISKKQEQILGISD